MGHSLIRSLVHSNYSLVRMLRTARSLTHSLMSSWDIGTAEHFVQYSKCLESLCKVFPPLTAGQVEFLVVWIEDWLHGCALDGDKVLAIPVIAVIETEATKQVSPSVSMDMGKHGVE